MDSCLGHMLESIKGIEIKLGTYIDVNEEIQKTRNIILAYILLELSLFSLKFFFVMSWCTSGVGLQVLPFIDISHLWSILRFQRFSCFSNFLITQLMLLEFSKFTEYFGRIFLYLIDSPCHIY